jgi:hypothetical protein
MLQDRVGKVRDFVDSCRSALELVYRSLFPLNEQPQGLGDLMRKFQDGAQIMSFMHEQLVAGATVKVHYPRLDFSRIGQGVPLNTDGEVKLLEPHYEVVAGPARSIIVLLEDKMDMLLERLDSPM